MENGADFYAFGEDTEVEVTWKLHARNDHWRFYEWPRLQADIQRADVTCPIYVRC